MSPPYINAWQTSVHIYIYLGRDEYLRINFINKISYFLKYKIRSIFFIINPVGTQSDFDITTCSSSEEDDNGRNHRAKKRKLDDYNDRDKWGMYMYNFYFLMF